MLARLVGTSNAHDDEAVLFDLAELIADLGPATATIAWLEKRAGPMPPALWDALIATYIENGAPLDAIALVRAQPAERAVPDIACRRWTRNAALARNLSDVDEREQLRRVTAAPDTGCEAEIADERCALALVRRVDDRWPAELANSVWPVCRDHLSRHPDDRPVVELGIAYQDWPGDRASGPRWLICELYAARALALPGADALAVAALENASYVSDCSPAPVDEIRARATELAAAPRLSADLHARVAALEAFAPTCAAVAPP